MYIKNFIKKAQYFKKKIKNTQENIKKIIIKVKSIDNIIQIIINIKGEIKKILINKKSIHYEKNKLLEDLILIAINDAKNQVNIKNKKEIIKLNIDILN